MTKYFILFNLESFFKLFTSLWYTLYTISPQQCCLFPYLHHLHSADPVGMDPCKQNQDMLAIYTKRKCCFYMMSLQYYGINWIMLSTVDNIFNWLELNSSNVIICSIAMWIKYFCATYSRKHEFWRNTHDTDAVSKFTPYFKVNTV